MSCLSEILQPDPHQELSVTGEPDCSGVKSPMVGGQDNIVLGADLCRVLQCDQLVLHYQPQVDFETGRIVGAEALLRWRKPDVGLVYPLSFLHLAERSILIASIGEWVLREACSQRARWQRLGLRDIRISVNVSPFHFVRHDMEALVAEILRTCDFDPVFLDLEITESGLLDTSERTLATLHRIKALGVQLSIDDFGMGYSSLNYVKYFPVDRLKVDRSFVSSLTKGSRDVAIVQAIATLAHALDIPVIAEGIETEQQLAQLGRIGCDEGQGFYFSPPLNADAFETLLSANPAFQTPTRPARLGCRKSCTP